MKKFGDNFNNFHLIRQRYYRIFNIYSMRFDEIIKLPVKVKMSLFKNKELKKELIENTKFLPDNTGIG